MSAALKIRTLLAKMPVGQIFTSRDLIGMCTREALDTCLHRLVDEGAILRLARGVFCNGNTPPNITPFELAQIKAGAFHKEVYEHATTTAERLGYIPKTQGRNNKVHTFVTNGTGSTSFQSIFGRINLKAASARKRPQHRNEVWELVKSLWHLGQHGGNSTIWNRVRLVWGRKSQESLLSYCASIPQWLCERFPPDINGACKKVTAKLIPSATTGQTASEPEKCCCPQDGNCICPMMSCKHCQMIPIRNRFSIALG